MEAPRTVTTWLAKKAGDCVEVVKVMTFVAHEADEMVTVEELPTV